MSTHDHEQPFFAHSVAGSKDTSDWEPLADHLCRVASIAEQFAEQFTAGAWGRLAGLWHDLGKYSLEFQSYLLTANGFPSQFKQRTKVDHSTAGARHAKSVFGSAGQLLAYVIAGHHAGLANAVGSLSSLEQRLNRKGIPKVAEVSAKLLSVDTKLSPPHVGPDMYDRETCPFQLAFFTRMIFSCLVDADFLATEEFMNPLRTKMRPVNSPDQFVAIKTDLDDYLKRLVPAELNTVGQCRQDVLAACRNAAKEEPGFFSLTVPTGGGKTLSSLAFALDHAVRHNKRRMIYAIPFTSIIEQTADVFRKVVANPDIVLEHHSNLVPDDDSTRAPDDDTTRDSDDEPTRSRLATENWDAPLIVTTNVQLFESLFASKTSRCRKLHRIANSVIILDEAQTLPVDLLRPCLAALKELVRAYGCTIVLCTATQPAIEFNRDFKIGLSGVREIIPRREELYRAMRRVSVSTLGRITQRDLLDRLQPCKSFLTIVNTRAHAASLYRDFVDRQGSNEATYHLSTLMCGQHRTQSLGKIKQQLRAGQPCRVFSTQLIEAGVDVDFPVVFRSLTGLDSVAQAAGRCNREGRLDRGVVYLFEPDNAPLQGYLASVAQSTREIMPRYDDLLDPAAIHKYFELHYWKQQGTNRWDKVRGEGVMDCFRPGATLPLNFDDAAKRFKFIEENGKPVFVQYDDTARMLLDELRLQLNTSRLDRRLMRRLQRYSVTLFDHLYREMHADIEVLRDEAGHHEFAVLVNPDAYDPKLGVRIDRPGFIEPASMVQ